VTDAIPDKELPALYLLGEKYITSIKELGASNGAKVVVLPADIMKAVGGLLGGNR
jgi:hypothetical protein